jgi:RNA polymerase sigma-70 factor, ECF subfamily
MLVTLFLTVDTAAEKSPGPSDERLVRSAQRGDSGAFAALHDRYYTRIYRLAYLKTNNASDAEDVASETFLRAFASLPRFRFPIVDSPSFYPWLHRIAINLIVDSARHRQPTAMVSLDAPLVAGIRQILIERLAGTSRLSPQEVVERQEVQQLVRSAIAALPHDQGDVLVHRFLGELSLREISVLMGRSEPAVKSLLHRAVVALRREILKKVDTAERMSYAGGDNAQGAFGKNNAEELQYVGRTTGNLH